jgi:hypothetical protein
MNSIEYGWFEFQRLAFFMIHTDCSINYATQWQYYSHSLEAIIHVNANDFDSWNISTSLYSTIWIPLWPDYWSRSICKTSTDKLYTCSHSVTLLSISEKSVRKPSSHRISSQEMFAYISITIYYDRSSYKFERPALTWCMTHVSTFNLFRIYSPVQSQPITTKYFAWACKFKSGNQ